MTEKEGILTSIERSWLKKEVASLPRVFDVANENLRKFASEHELVNSFPLYIDHKGRIPPTPTDEVVSHAVLTDLFSSGLRPKNIEISLEWGGFPDSPELTGLYLADFNRDLPYDKRKIFLLNKTARKDKGSLSQFHLYLITFAEEKTVSTRGTTLYKFAPKIEELNEEMGIDSLRAMNHCVNLLKAIGRADLDDIRSGENDLPSYAYKGAKWARDNVSPGKKKGFPPELMKYVSISMDWQEQR